MFYKSFLLGSSLILSTSAATSYTPANPIREELSFGQTGVVHSPHNPHYIPNFTLDGQHGLPPEILSDRVILTPPWPGNQRRSIWSDHGQTDEHWSAELEFRVSGQEHSTGNMQLWYTKQKHDIMDESIYTVGKWDGLAIVVSAYGGHGGSIRGFMNDRTISVSNIRPIPIVVPTCPMIRRSLTTIEAMVNANTNPADVTTLPVPAMARMMPVLSPA